MEEQDSFIDYYKVLESDRMASSEELKKSYQRLAISSHPDKNDKDVREDRFLLIQEAWSVLRDPQSRKQYNAALTCHENSECLLYDTITLSDMKVEEGGYTYTCRCGGTYILEAKSDLPSNIIIGCGECSFSIQLPAWTKCSTNVMTRFQRSITICDQLSRYLAWYTPQWRNSSEDG